MNLNDFIDKVIAQKNKKITDEVFLLIQNDKELMKEYLDHVGKIGNLKQVNQQIGRKVKEKYGLTNDEQRNTDPTSTLISSHQEFK